tara:strand:+ start:1753 stop:2346 length:594 start_codon:yes stop_codon:yes gene_type:complete
MLRKIKVYGDLADFLGWKEQEALVNNIPDVMKFILCNHPDAESYMKNKYYKVNVGQYDITDKQLNDPIGMTVTITPVIQGSDPVTAIVVGGALSGAAAVGVIGTGVIVGSLTYASLATTVGVGLMLNGASQLLTPTPNIPNIPSQINDLDSNANYSFSGIKNVSRAGITLPLVYGEIFIGSITVSNGVDTHQVKGEA